MLKHKKVSHILWRIEVKACFQHSIACGAYKDLTRRTPSDTVLLDKVFKIASNPLHDDYEKKSLH